MRRERAGDLRGCRKRSTPRLHRPDEGLGRSRGGLTCKIHLSGEGGRRPLALLITPGQWDDTPQLIPVMERIRVHRPGGGHPRTRSDHLGGERRIPAGATAATCDVARSSTPFPNPEISAPTAKDAAAGADGPSASTRRSTNSGTKWSGRLTC
jgi:hypothetical protein